MNEVLTPYGNRRIRSYSLQNVRSWYVLSSRLAGFVPYYLQFLEYLVLSTMYDVLLEITWTYLDRSIPKVDVIIRARDHGASRSLSFSALICM